MNVADEVFGFFAGRGAEAYFGECVSITDHVLQAAWFACEEGASANLVIAALLHDIGHLLNGAPEHLADWRHDQQHERIGAAWLQRWFVQEVSEPVRLHVPAKRYLCAIDPGYLGQLSPASVRTLQLQGGPMSAAEAKLFEREHFFHEALRVRGWDDRAKIADLRVPGIISYRARIERQTRPAGWPQDGEMPPADGRGKID